jgi:hypothetical protein
MEYELPDEFQSQKNPLILDPSLIQASEVFIKFIRFLASSVNAPSGRGKVTR